MCGGINPNLAQKIEFVWVHGNGFKIKAQAEIANAAVFFASYVLLKTIEVSL